MKTFKCHSCGVRKLLTSFHKCKAHPHKHNYRCKACMKAWVKKNRIHLNSYKREHSKKPKIRFTLARLTSKYRNIPWKLTLQQYEKLIQKKCYYCNDVLPSIGSGLDRKNNDKKIGYTIRNVLPCCTACNRIKSMYLSVEEMKVAMKAVLKLRKAYTNVV